MTGRARRHASPEWQKFRRKWRPVIKAQLPLPCVECGRAVRPGEPFHLAHIIAWHLAPELAFEPSNVGPAHPGCNTSEGGKQGRAMQTKSKRSDLKLPSEGSGW